MPGPVSQSYEPPKNHTVYCAFCGHPYPPGTPTSRAAILAEHIEVCPEHPIGAKLRAALARISALEADNERLRDIVVDLAHDLDNIARAERGEPLTERRES